MAEKNKDVIAEKSSSSKKNSLFSVAEAYKKIRTNLLFTLANTDSHTVVFSSAEPSAGKSTLSSNLAIVMAQTGARVILVDADMRKPMQHHNFRLSKTNGLSRILGGLGVLDECIYRQVMPNLDVLLSGSIPPNPSELLGTERMRALVKELEKRYDYVFIDMPPLAVVTDALLVTPYTAGIVLVARQRQTIYEELNECVESVRRVGGSFLGTVVTDVRAEMSSYTQYSRQRYYRSYDYEYGGTGRAGQDAVD